jgi:hypothetical protein
MTAFFRNLLSAKANQAAILAAQKGGMVTDCPSERQTPAEEGGQPTTEGSPASGRQKEKAGEDASSKSKKIRK